MMRERIYIIAEAGVNHNGSFKRALQMIAAAADAGADAVKFQTFKAEQLVTKTALKAAYQMVSGDIRESQYDMLKKLELKNEYYPLLVKFAHRHNIDFISSPFDFESFRVLTMDLKLPVIKLPSGEITNGPLLLEAGRSRKKIILSTGMSNLEEINAALGVLAFGYIYPDKIPVRGDILKAYHSQMGRRYLRGNVTLLHCTSEYPAPFDEVNLNAIGQLRSQFGLNVGLSDHSMGIVVPIAAVSLGITVLEKHFTISRKLRGPDHKASLTPMELKIMVTSIRQAEKAMGRPLKNITTSEKINIRVVRKSIFAANPIKKGERFTQNNISIKRPGGGLSPFKYWSILNKKAKRDFNTDDKIEL